MNDGQILRLTGREGVVITEGASTSGKSMMGGAPDQMPQRGRLEDVKLELFTPDEIDRLDQNLSAHPSLTATMNNAVFDSDASRIYTDDCTIAGRHVPGHQVPILVTGDDYDFAGQGLLVRWNDRLHRLQLLEVHTGDKLIIKGRGPLNFARGPQLTPQSSTTKVAAAVPPPHPITTSKSPSHTPLANKNHAPTLYRATFDQNVRIFQGDQLLATAVTLQVDFLPKSSQTSTTKPSTTYPDATDSRPIATTTPVQPTTRPATSPAASPAQSPIVVRWTGPLRVTPLAPSADEPTEPGQSIIHLTGAPVTLTSQGNNLQAASVVYRTVDDSARLVGSAQMPVVMKDPRGAVVTTQSMLYRPRQHLAELFGAGHATGLVQSENTQHRDHLDATWSRQATIHFRPAANESQEQMDIASALLDGDVHIQHPQIQLDGDRLNLVFSSVPKTTKSATGPSNSSELHFLLATGHVHARLLDKQNGEQRLQSGQLELTMAKTPDGRPYPHIVQADEQVLAHLIKQDQQLRADHLTVTLAPSAHPTTQAATQEAIALQTLHATGHVHLQDPQSRADGDELHVKMTGDQPDVTLTGQPARLTGQNGDQLTGSTVRYTPAQHRAAVIGPGELAASQQSSDGKSRPFHASWQQGIKLNGDTNRIDLHGQVVTTSTDPDGSQLTARGDNLTLFLAPAATRPQTTKSKIQNSKSPGSPDFLQNKQVHEALFTGHASIQSLLTQGDAVMRRMYLESSTIQYNLPGQKLIVPQPGRMLVEDHQPPKSSTTSPTPNTTTAPSARGNTAFSWSKRLTFDQSAHLAMLLGDVRIVHHPEIATGSAFPFVLEAQQVTAEFAPAKSNTATPASTQSSMQLTRLTAKEDVHITSQERKVDAASIIYNPATSILTAAGQGNQPVRLQNADGTLRGWFESLTYNLKDDQIIQMKNAQLKGQP
jgi:lipopolysaccharide export system protein LptA